MNINFSLVLPCYNEEQNIGDLLSMLVNQTYRSNYEIIIANDRSTDNTKKIILEYKKNYQTIELIDISSLIKSNEHQLDEILNS